MRKDLGKLTGIFPCPVTVVATYDENKNVDVMLATWCGMCSGEHVVINVGETSKTLQNIKYSKAFTLSMADRKYLAQVDFLGMSSAKKMPDKFERTGFHAVESDYVNAPLIEELPLTLECEFEELRDEREMKRIVGKIINISADESVLDHNGTVEPEKLNAVVFDPYGLNYFGIGSKVADAYKIGSEISYN